MWVDANLRRFETGKVIAGEVHKLHGDPRPPVRQCLHQILVGASLMSKKQLMVSRGGLVAVILCLAAIGVYQYETSSSRCMLRALDHYEAGRFFDAEYWLKRSTAGDEFYIEPRIWLARPYRHRR